MSMLRKLMRNVTHSMGRRASLGGAPAVGFVRAGMHQQAEHEYQRSRMADDAHHEESAEDALDLQETLEGEIPPAEEEDGEEAAAIAEGEAAVTVDKEILEEIADPEAAAEEETAGCGQGTMDSGVASDAEELTLSGRQGADGPRAQLEVDYSAERIPVLAPVTGGSGADGSAELVYDPGDGSLKEIQEPLPGMEHPGVLPFMPEVKNPSANVPAAGGEQDLHIDFSAACGCRG